jgi:hypothetical protein
MQPAIQAPTGALLGRVSLGDGGPEPISVGTGLGIQSSVLTANGADHADFPSRTVLVPSDQAVVSSGGTPMLLNLSLLRGLFSAGSNIAIDSAGIISAAGSITSTGVSGTSNNISGLPAVTTIAADDLVGISRNGTADSITYQNFLNGLTIDEAQVAISVSDSDKTWVAQGSDTMVCQTFSAIWDWIVSNQPSYKNPVVEITTNTTLDGTVHNGRILVCSQPITLTPVFANMGSGFMCSIINLSGANVAFGVGIVSSSGTSVLATGLSCTMQGLTYSGGSVIYASISGDTTQSTQNIPNAVTNFVVSGVSSNSVSLAWAAPSSGGAAASYTVQYQKNGETGWITASSSVVGTSYIISNLQSSTTYNLVIFATNSAGAGPLSGVVTDATVGLVGNVPGQVTGVVANTPTSSTLSLAWSAPAVGTAPINYTIDYRPSGTTLWTTYASSVLSVSMSIIGLSAGTIYDFQVFASNVQGVGIPSVVISRSTATVGTSVTAITWNLTPSSTYMHGSGSIGVNAHVTPSSAAVQFGFSTSPTALPANWTLATYINTDLWGAYVSTPATLGSWYAWVQGIDGSLSMVYATPFAVT